MFQLKLQGDQRGYGKTLAETGVILRRGPNRVVGPDSCFVAAASLPLGFSPEEFLTAVPALIVEVRSKNETTAELERKAGEYLAAGAQLVWILDPIRAAAVVYQAGHPPKLLSVVDDLTAEGIIPGFRLNVGEVLRV